MKIIAYLRISTTGQDLNNQRLAILDYAHEQNLKISQFIEVQSSSRKSIKERNIDQLFSSIQAGDLVLVSELSRLGRSVGQIIQLIDELIKLKVRFMAIKENIQLNGKQDIQSKMMVTMFGLFAEIERGLISERTREGFLVTSQSLHKNRSKKIIELSYSEARDYFLLHESYSTIELPSYFTFDEILIKISRHLQEQKTQHTAAKIYIKNICGGRCPSEKDNVNYKLLTNKDGEYAWREFQLIHPVLYVALVHALTTKENWAFITNAFKEFEQCQGLKCTSVPAFNEESTIAFRKSKLTRLGNNTITTPDDVLEKVSKKDYTRLKCFDNIRFKALPEKCGFIAILNAMTRKTAKEIQIITWKEDAEQFAIQLSLEYRYVFHTDIVDCYGSIYTHALVWALHGKELAKQNKHQDNWKREKIGCIIDEYLCMMSSGETNGIPQGSILMDFIAEIFLGYIDTLLLKRVKGSINDKFEIIRHRDDYRIFVNSPEQGKRIIKLLSEVLIEVGMRLNPEKTNSSGRVVEFSVKPDKLYWLRQQQHHSNLQSRLLVIQDLAKKYPNSGVLVSSLTKLDQFVRRKQTLSSYEKTNTRVLIAIIMDIAYRNPRIYHIAVAIVSRFLKCFEVKDVKSLIQTALTKSDDLPNTELLYLWLQRSVIYSDSEIKDCYYKSVRQYKEQYKLLNYIENNPPTQPIIMNDEVKIWDCDWIKNTHLRNLIMKTSIMQEMNLDSEISHVEIATFHNPYC